MEWLQRRDRPDSSLKAELTTKESGHLNVEGRLSGRLLPFFRSRGGVELRRSFAQQATLSLPTHQRQRKIHAGLKIPFLTIKTRPPKNRWRILAYCSSLCTL